jgi:hypothetical protein
MYKRQMEWFRAALKQLFPPEAGAGGAALGTVVWSSAKWASLSQLATRKWALLVVFLVVLLVVAGLALTNKGLGGWNAATVLTRLTGAPATATTSTAKAVANAGGIVSVAQAD